MEDDLGNGPRYRGFERLKQVYSELYEHLSDDYTVDELLIAAQALIDAAAAGKALDEESSPLHRKFTYYSGDTFDMLSRTPWVAPGTEIGFRAEIDDCGTAETELYARYRNLHPVYQRRWYTMGNPYA